MLIPLDAVLECWGVAMVVHPPGSVPFATHTAPKRIRSGTCGYRQSGQYTPPDVRRLAGTPRPQLPVEVSAGERTAGQRGDHDVRATRRCHTIQSRAWTDATFVAMSAVASSAIRRTPG